MLETIGAITGVIGAILISFNFRYSFIAFPVWILSSLAWILYAKNTNQDPLLLQQIVFLCINAFGLYRWMIEPKQKITV